MAKARQKRASRQAYMPVSQLRIDGFTTPFEQQLDPGNRWAVLASKIPWDLLVNIYNRGLRNESTGATGINPRVVVGALIIKHLEAWSDRETLQHIQENMYLQYFLGFSSFVKEPIFDPSCFVDFRRRMDLQAFEELNTAIVRLSFTHTTSDPEVDKKKVIMAG
ncbi:transposase [Leadbetterella sp. DM7]|uniref:transposase n=1 Tax=Leadbetterella sp. DM7 TaxID=3235085 RepID=UPI00349EA9F4